MTEIPHDAPLPDTDEDLDDGGDAILPHSTSVLPPPAVQGATSPANGVHNGATKAKDGTTPARYRRPATRPRVGDIRRAINAERQEALDLREPLAIRYAGERWDVITEALKGLDDDARLEPWSVTVGVSAAAKALGFNAREIRALIRAGRLPARKVKNEWRIPLDALL
ncbi:MAG: helix-turn-helix domain-containing protein [Dehalococcoidia bacterium]|nr:helix-turn-helix domain-containing protein [Dehalococcoidia bacterium]